MQGEKARNSEAKDKARTQVTSRICSQLAQSQGQHAPSAAHSFHTRGRSQRLSGTCSPTSSVPHLSLHLASLYLSSPPAPYMPPPLLRKYPPHQPTPHIYPSIYGLHTCPSIFLHHTCSHLPAPHLSLHPPAPHQSLHFLALYLSPIHLPGTDSPFPCPSLSLLPSLSHPAPSAPHRRYTCTGRARPLRPAGPARR